MLKIVHFLFRSFFKSLEMLFPTTAGKWAVNLFFTPPRFKSPHRENGFLKESKISKRDFTPNIKALYDLDWPSGRVYNANFNNASQKKFYTFYEMGNGPVILLVHGWAGRASQMGSIAKLLVNKGYKIITFDAFAHGTSPGKQTTVLEFVEIIKNLHNDFGPFEAIIGHSLGGIAAAKAIESGVSANKLVTIGSPTTMQFILEAFCEIINASAKTLNYIKVFVENYARTNASEFSLTHISRNLTIPGLVIHDKDDKEAAYENALILDESWGNGKLLSTSGLGHSRILRDHKTIEYICDFMGEKKAVFV